MQIPPSLGVKIMIIGNATTKAAAFDIARPAAQEYGYVYVCQWSSQHWTIEDHKPLLRGPIVIEVRDNGTAAFCA